MDYRPTLTLTWFLLTLAPTAQAATLPGLDKAKALISAECAANRFSGLMAVLLDGREVAFEICGRAQYPEGPPITRGTRFKLFSTSKQFTAAAIVRLASQGKLRLDDPLERWLPEAPPAWRGATIRHLLMHRAGIPNTVDAYGEGYRADAAQAIANWLAANQATPSDFSPGTQYRYSNMGYELLTAIAEKATGRPWPAILQREVLRPSGMREAFLETATIVDGEARGSTPDPKLAQGYNGTPSKLEPTSSYAFVLRGSGALHATLADLVAYERALLRGKPLSQAEQRQMYEQPLDRYGLGWIVRNHRAGRLNISHSGGINGFAVEFARIPERKIAIILLNNLGFSDVETYRRQIVELLDPAPNDAALNQPPSPANAWRDLALADLNVLHSQILNVHPRMVDPELPDFPRRVETAYREALTRAGAASDYWGWRAATQGFIQSFRDGHVIFEPLLTPGRIRWPGFLIDGREGGYVVRRPSGMGWGQQVIPDGARVISCDGTPIAQAVTARLDRVEADLSKEPERLHQAWRFLIDYRSLGPPPAKICRFEINGQASDGPLEWRTANYSSLAPRLDVFTREVQRPLGRRTLANGMVWLQLSGFSDHSRLEELAVELERETEKVRRAPAIVIDLRGNRGGTSTWGGRFASVIWGPVSEWREGKATAQSARPGLGKFWRATPDAADLAKLEADSYGPGAPYANPEAMGYFSGVAKLMRSARAQGRVLAEDACCSIWAKPDPPAGAEPAPLYRNPVFVLTDTACFSSCIAAIAPFDLMGATIVGEPTGQNSEGGEVFGPLYTPSGLARYFVPVSIIRFGGNVRLAYSVSRRLAGATDDTAGLGAWISAMVFPPGGGQ